MKPSHMKTPRTIDECNFTPGYKSWEQAGHSLVPWFCAAGLVALVLMGWAGWLPGSAA